MIYCVESYIDVTEQIYLREKLTMYQRVVIYSPASAIY